jgi:hypothetical protein
VTIALQERAIAWHPEHPEGRHLCQKYVSQSISCTSWTHDAVEALQFTVVLERVQALVIGGCGRVGSAVAIHMLSDAGREGPMHVAIAGRRSKDAMQPVYEEIVTVCCLHRTIERVVRTPTHAMCLRPWQAARTRALS